MKVAKAPMTSAVRQLHRCINSIYIYGQLQESNEVLPEVCRESQGLTPRVTNPLIEICSKRYERAITIDVDIIIIIYRYLCQ